MGETPKNIETFKHATNIPDITGKKDKIPLLTPPHENVKGVKEKLTAPAAPPNEAGLITPPLTVEEINDITDSGIDKNEYAVIDLKKVDNVLKKIVRKVPAQPNNKTNPHKYLNVVEKKPSPDSILPNQIDTTNQDIKKTSGDIDPKTSDEKTKQPEASDTGKLSLNIDQKTSKDKAKKPDSKDVPEQNPDIAAMLGMDIQPEVLIEALLKKGTKREEAINAFMLMQQKIIDNKDKVPKPEPARVAGAIDIQLALYYQKLYEYTSLSDEDRSVTELVSLQNNIQKLLQMRTDLGLPRNNYVTETFNQLGLDSFLKEKAHSEAERLKIPDAKRPEWEEEYVNNHTKGRAIESFSEYVNTAMKNNDKLKLLVNGYKNRLLSYATKGNPANATKEQIKAAEDKAQEMGVFMERKGIFDNAKEGGIIAFFISLAIIAQIAQEAHRLEVKNKQAA